MVVGECEEASTVVEVIDEQRADQLVTDIRMPSSGGDEGIRLAATLRRTHPAPGVIVLGTYGKLGLWLLVPFFVVAIFLVLIFWSFRDPAWKEHLHDA